MAMCNGGGAMQGGAFTFLTKPYMPDQLIATLANAVETSSLRRKVAAYQKSSELEALIDRQLIGEIRRRRGSSRRLPGSRRCRSMC